MQFQESVEICVTKKYATFDGTATRSEFWWFVLFIVIVNVLLNIVSKPLGGIFALAMLVPLYAAGARRLHDTNRSGWWQLISLLPVIGTIILIVFYAQEGKTPATPT